MSLVRLILASLAYHRRTNLAVALAVMAATAVLTGALAVGDSMRGSLRHLLLDQLGAIDEVLVTDRFFRPELAKELTAAPRFEQFFDQAVPAVFVQGTVEHPRSGGACAGNVTVLGIRRRSGRSAAAVRKPRRPKARSCSTPSWQGKLPPRSATR